MVRSDLEFLVGIANLFVIEIKSEPSLFLSHLFSLLASKEKERKDNWDYFIHRLSIRENWKKSRNFPLIIDN
jgi:hypothetical protein